MIHLDGLTHGFLPNEFILCRIFPIFEKNKTMRLGKKSFVAFLLFISFSDSLLAQSDLSVKSPNGNLNVAITLDKGTPFYTVDFGESPFFEASPLGLTTSIGDFTKELTFVTQTQHKIDEAYLMLNAKASNIHYLANEATVTYVNPAKDTLQVVFRVSNQDIAFSYVVKGGNRQTNVIIHEEATAYNLPDDTTIFLSSQALPMTGWEQTKPSYEEEYLFDQPVGTPSLNKAGFTYPGLFKLNGRGWVLVSETGVDGSYVGSRLGEGNKEGLYTLEFPQPGENNGLTETFAAMALPAQTPWRTLTLGKTLKPIVESTVAFDVVKPKYAPSMDYQPGRATWSWIVWQDWSINYEDQVKYIDLAAALDFEYVLVDNWWDQRIGRDRIEQLAKYANSKGVSLVLWYNSNGYWNNAPQTPQDRMNTAPARNAEMASMQKIGVKGIKVDFFGGDK